MTSAKRIPHSSTTVENGDCVAIVGAGPAGSFFAIHLLREAKRQGRALDVVLIEKRSPSDPEFSAFQCRGCNYCAGIISPRLNETLVENGLGLPPEVIQQQINYVWIHGQWKNLRLRVPEGQHIYSVYRGSLPGRRGGTPTGFDGFLLGEAIGEGARIVHGKAQSAAYGADGRPVVTVKGVSGEVFDIEASFVAFATGINGHYGLDPGSETLAGSIRGLNPRFVPSKSRRTLIFELEVGEEYLKRNLNNEMYFIEYGSKRLAIEHTALIPKGRFLTVAMIGGCVDRAVLPQDSKRIIQEFLALQQVESILPGIGSAPLGCVCAPSMTVHGAASPYGDRFAIIGDAVASRLNKDGLYSAYITAEKLAKAVLDQGVDERALKRGYGKAIGRLANDNLYGRAVYAISRTAFTLPLLSRVAYQAFATEYKVHRQGDRPLSRMLWKIASGTADYGEVLGEMLSWGVLRSVLSGAGITLRNVAVELLVGLKWGKFGRYPAVVPVERREALKEEIAWQLGMDLGPAQGFERMYAIKIRGTDTEIMEQLAKYGKSDARFLQLRFVHARQTRGTPNQPGSVIEYRFPLLGLSAELTLARRVRNETLFYAADDGLVDAGRLIFSISPLGDGNRRLAIYAAFDYKKGTNLASRLFWKTGHLLFPEFVHDVVWNHALCTIKDEVEQRHGQPDFGRADESEAQPPLIRL